MNDDMHDLAVITAVLLYQRKGIAYAVAFLRNQGWETVRIFSFFESVDALGDKVDANFFSWDAIKPQGS